MYTITAAAPRAIGVNSILVFASMFVPFVFIAIGTSLLLGFGATVLASQARVLRSNASPGVHESSRSGAEKRQGIVIDTSWERID